jgi:hypothetical protein
MRSSSSKNEIDIPFPLGKIGCISFKERKKKGHLPSEKNEVKFYKAGFSEISCFEMFPVGCGLVGGTVQIKLTQLSKS